jgi:4-amino-4-deoxy-L-arabinose transferase-like glycosyltransferase
MPSSFVASLQRHPVACLLGVLALLYAWNLGIVELSVTDEARSGMIVRDMIAGNVILPRTPDGYLVEKPPAYYGSCALAGLVFGVNEWTLRAISVLAALGTLAVTAWIVRFFGSPRAAVLAVAALGSNILFLTSAREAMVDMTLTLFLTIGFASYVAGRLGRVTPEHATGLCGLAFGFAVLTKGPLFLVLPTVIFGVDFLIETRGRFWSVRRPWAPALGAILLAIVVAALWYAPGLALGKGEFLETSILSENFRMPTGHASGIGVAHHKPPYYYAEWQALTLLPFLPFLVAIPAWLRDPANRVPRLLLGCWIVVGFALFQAASNKRFYYLVPLQPAVAALLGLATDAWIGRKDARRWSLVVVGSAVALAGLGSAIVPFLHLRWGGARSAELVAAIARHRLELIGFGVGLAAVGAGMAFAARRGSAALLSSAVALALGVVAVRVGLGDRFIADFNRTRPFVREMKAKLPEGALPVISPPIAGYALDFYWPVPLRRDFVEAQGAEFVLIAQSSLGALAGVKEELGLWKYGDKSVVLVRRAP